jgi:D-proline reductase (dithiol) PrdB
MSRFINQFFSKIFQLDFVKNNWAKKFQSLDYSETPWSALEKPLKDAKVCFISTAGIHLKKDQAFNMTDKEGDPTYRSFPADVDLSTLKITHDYYNHSDADKDINIVLPFDALKECHQEGSIGSFSEDFYSFMGHIEGKNIKKLVQNYCQELAKKLVKEQVDIALVSPA